MAAEDLMAARYARTMSAIGNEARMRGWANPVILAVTVAQMLAIATRVSASDAIERFRDRSFELSSAEWRQILSEVTATEPRLQPFLGVVGEMSGRPSEPFPPGLIDSVRRHLLDAIAPEIEAASSRGAAPLLLLLAVLDLARHPTLGDAMGLNRNTQILLADALAVRAGERAYLYCHQAGAAGLALFLAAERGARVRLDVVEREAAGLILWLALAGRLDVDARVFHPMPRAGSPSDWPSSGVLDGEKYDVAILLPPFGELKARGFTDEAWHSLGLPPANNLDGFYVMFAATRAARAACVSPNSFLFRTTRAEQLLKEHVIRQHGLETVIGLPREALGRHGGPQASILLFRVDRQPHSGWQLLMVDAKQAAEIDPNAWHERVGEAIRMREDSEISVRVSMEEISRQDFNITAERYVLDPAAKQVRDLLAHAMPLDKLVDLHRPQALGGGRGREMPDPNLLELPLDLLEVGVTDIDEAGIIRQPKKQVPATPEVVQRSRKSRLEPGDLLLVIKGSVGKVGYVLDIPEGKTWLASQSFVIVRLNPHGPIADPLVLFRFLSSEIGQAAIRNLAVGTTIPGLQMADVRRIPVLIPPPPTQADIVDELRALLALHDRIVAMRNEFSERMRIMWPEDTVRAHEGG